MKRNILYKLPFLILYLGLCCCTSHKTGQNIREVKSDPVSVIDTSLKVLPQSDSIKKYSNKMKRFYKYSEPSKISEKWYLPFDISDRSDFKLIKLISDYGTYRSGHVKGHIHSGIDIIPAHNKDTIYVYPLSVGKVCLLRPTAPNKTVIIKHKLNDSTVIYSSYIHLKEIYIENGQEVNPITKIGVLYTKAEALIYKGNYDHLHLEIKKRIDDYCCASWLCMSQKELDEYFYNPLNFLKSKISH